MIAKCNWDSKRCRQLASEIMKIIDEIKTHKKNKLKKINKDREEKKGGTEAIVKVWELHDFVVRLSQVFSN